MHSRPLSVVGFLVIISIVAMASRARADGQAAWHDIDARDAAIAYHGRMSFELPGGPVMWWPGSSVEIRFRGKGIAWQYSTVSMDSQFTVVLDGRVTQATPRVVTGNGGYVVSSNIFPPGGLRPGTHDLLLWLRSETWNPVWIGGFQATNDAKLIPVPPAARKIEFFGDSITCGYGNEGTAADQRTDANSNNYLSYGADVCRMLNAEYRCTARSGIAITTSWATPPSAAPMMPNYYDRLDPDKPHSWDFSKWTPDAVVINLGENDSGIYKMGIHPDPGAAADTAAYKAFVASIRAAYPRATIFCVLGPMDAVRGPWKDYEMEAVKELTDAGDSRIFFLPLDVRTGPTLSGCGGHPNVAEHQVMADLLAPFIASHMGWKYSPPKDAGSK